jgi:hypothetical protein
VDGVPPTLGFVGRRDWCDKGRRTGRAGGSTPTGGTVTDLDRACTPVPASAQTDSSIADVVGRPERVLLVTVAVAGFGILLAPEQLADTDSPRPPAPHRNFDPRRVGILERDVWVAYYQRRWLRLLCLSISLVHAAFRMGAVATAVGAWHAVRANQLWAPVVNNDPIGARRHMKQFYRLLQTRTRHRCGTSRVATVAN